ncbi:uncharacterized protein LOC117103145 [Anneissia japonica]|uniref:uncharacterized protein LOC117103145 n=1 Tax=Anneissia japonica TaxID=1529436 RepID=UPI0014257B60|nr:uncharacterized protein LOC117103145 [Anneissia japonica]
MDSLLSYRPFTQQWLNSVFQETLLPGSPWIKVRDVMCKSLAGSLEPELTNPEHRQMIFILLGHRFVANYFEQYEFEPRLLDNLRSEEKKKLQQDVQIILKDKMKKAVKECGYSHSPVEDPDDTPDDLMQYWQHTRKLLEKGLQRHRLHEEDKSPHNTWQQIKGVAGVITSNPSEPPNCWSHMSDTLSHSILAILRRAPHRLQNVCSRLLGRQLPASLRRYIWTNCTLRSSSLSSTAFRTHEKAMRNKYGKSVSKGKLQLKIQNASETPVNRLISKSVAEVMEKTPSMQSYQTLSLKEHIRKIINIMFTYNQVFEPYLIHWLFPLVLAYREDSDAAEFSYEMAMYMDELQHGMFPTWPQVFSVAEGALQRLQQIDIDFYNHLQQSCSKEYMLDIKDYMVEMLMKEQQKSHGTGSMSVVNLSSPVMLARKWVGEGFVGVLDSQAVLYVWDQCFMQQWDHQVLQDVCLLLLLLLKYDFMLTNNYNEVKQVFTCLPAKLYTLDIVRGYQHLIRGDDPKHIPDLNRHWHSVTKPVLPENVEDDKEEIEEEEEELQMSPQPEEEEEEEEKLTAVGLKYFRLKLIMRQSLPKGKLPQKHFKALLDFKVSNLSLTVSFFVGDEMICSKSLTKTPRLIKEEMLFASLESQRKRGKIDTKVYLVQMAKEHLIFDVAEDLQNQGISTCDLEPYGIINISYRTSTKDNDGISIPLGWARVKLYNLTTQEADDLSSQPTTSQRAADTILQEGRTTVMLSVLSGEQTVPLYPGNPNFKVNSPEDGEEDSRNMLKEGSEVILDVFEVMIDDDFSQAPSSASLISEGEDDLEPPWVPQIESAILSPVDVNLKDTLDFYIDGIRFLPDNASISKYQLQYIFSFLSGGDDKTLSAWLTDRLNIAKHIPRGSAPILLDLTRCVRYNQKNGLTVAMKAAYNISADGAYTQCYGQIISGDSTTDDVANRTVNEKFVGKDVNMNSLECSPNWQDRPKVLHPSLNDNTVLLIKLITISGMYTPRNDGKGSPAVTLQDVQVSCIGWTVLQLFDRDCTFAGDHHIPIFKEPLSDVRDQIFMKEIRSKPLDTCLKSALKKGTIQFNEQHSSMLVEVRDGHFVKDDTVSIIKKNNDYLRLGSYKQFIEGVSTRAGEPVSKLLLRSLPGADKNSQAYKKEVKIYKQAMFKAFNDYIDTIN